MPTYSFVCLDCGKTYDVTCPMSERDKARCPHCGSDRKRQDYSGHALIRAQGAGSRTAPAAAGCG